MRLSLEMASRFSQKTFRENQRIDPPTLEGHPYVSGMAPSRPPAAAPFPASFPTGIWPPGQLHRNMEAPQRTVPGLGVGQPQLPVFNHMLSNHQVGHGPSIPYGQVPAQHQTLQREVVMETGPVFGEIRKGNG